MTAAAPLARATALHAAGVAANAQMRPVTALRHLRRALALLDGMPGAQADRLRGRVLVTAGLAESERGEVEAGLALLARAEPLLPRGERGTVHGQRGILLRRTGHDDLALEAYGRALQLLDPPPSPRRSPGCGSTGRCCTPSRAHPAPARADLRACLDLARAHGLTRLAAKARHNLGVLEHQAGDLPAALAGFRDVAEAYAVEAPGMLPVLALDRARALLSAGLVTEADGALADAVRRLGAQRVGQDLAEAQLERAAAALLAGRPGPAATRPAARRGCWPAGATHDGRRAPGSSSCGRTWPAGGAAARSVAGAALGAARRARPFGLGEQARVAAVLAAGRRGGRAVRATAVAGPTREILLAQNRPRARDRLDTRLGWRLAGPSWRVRGDRLRVAMRPEVSTTSTRRGPGSPRPTCAGGPPSTGASSPGSGSTWRCAGAGRPRCSPGASGPGRRHCSCLGCCPRRPVRRGVARRAARRRRRDRARRHDAGEPVAGPSRRAVTRSTDGCASSPGRRARALRWRRSGWVWIGCGRLRDAALARGCPCGRSARRPRRHRQVVGGSSTCTAGAGRRRTAPRARRPRRGGRTHAARAPRGGGRRVDRP